MHPSRKRARIAGWAVWLLVPGCLAILPGATLGSTPSHPAYAFRPGPIERPLAIATGDFDRDGKDDLVIANFAAGTIQILTAQGNGTYVGLIGPFGVGSASLDETTSGPFALFVTDLDPNDVDGDSIPNASDDCPNVYNPIDPTSNLQIDANGNGVGDACERGTDTNGDGIIDQPIDTDGDGVPDYDLVTHKLDNCPDFPNPGQEDSDNDHVGDACQFSPDIAVLTTSAGTGSPFGAVRFRLNDGEGGLAGRPSLLTGAAPGGLLLVDFNGDGVKDLVISNAPNNLLQYFPGAGDGQFGNQAILVTGRGPQGMVSGDIDGDGHPDLIVGDRGYKDPTSGLWAGSDLSIFRNSGAGLSPVVTSTVLTAGPAPTVLLAGRLNGDAMDDVVVLDQGGLSADGEIEVFLGSASGTLVPGQTIALGPGHAPRSGLLRDLDGDGKLDLLVPDFTGGQVLVFAGQGDGTFVPAPTPVIATGGQPADIVALDIDAPAPGGKDLAILDYQNDQILLYLNTGGLTFALAPTSPASPWRQTSAMEFFGADTEAGADIVLLQQDTARLDRMSGLGNGFFSPDRPVTIQALSAGAATDTATMAVDDFRFDNRQDMAVIDPSRGKLTLVTNDLTDLLTEQQTIDVPTGMVLPGTGPLSGSLDDFDHDGVPNRIDDCPTIYNPPGCKVTDPACAIPVLCKDPTQLLLDCAKTDPLTGQCDSDGNGIGDHCQVLSSTCAAVDSDFDTRNDYDPNALPQSSGQYDFDRDTIPNAIDNCPTVANADQTDSDHNGVGDACQVGIDTNGDGIIDTPIDTDGDGVPDYDLTTHVLDNCPKVPNPGQEDNDNDHVGNACIIAIALDNCPHTSNVDQTDTDGDGIGDLCATPSVGLIAPRPAANEVDLFTTDSAGSFHPAQASPLTGLATPAAALSGQFSLSCFPPPLPPLQCFSKTSYDVAVAEQGVVGDFTDDSIRVFEASDTPPYTTYTPLAPAPVAGDPSALMIGLEQPVCATDNDPSTPLLRFDSDGKSSILAAVEPGTSTLDVFLVSNMNLIDSTRSPLLRPIAHPLPLPVPAPLRAAVITDVNNDRRDDLVALSTQPGGPSVITVYIGIGNGLFFTDPILNPAPFPHEIKFMTQGNAFLSTKTFYPDLEFFDETTRAPIVMSNVFLERADIDGSGRVDGYDLALLASAFGATRGEDYTIQADGTLVQTGTGLSRVVVGTGSPVLGQDVGDLDTPCDGVFQPLTGSYGLQFDLNLDGVVDGTDLAILASEFGQTNPGP